MSDRRWFSDLRWRVSDALRRRREQVVLRLVWALPRSVAYWCAIRVIAHATTGQYSSQVVPELTAMDALKRWEPHG